MQLTLKLKMAPDDAQRASLLRTMVRFNEACDDIGIVAFQYDLVNKLKLQRIVYYDVRERFGLSAQLTVRAISKVCDAFRLNRKVRPRFKPHGAIVYDQRILSWKGIDRVSILTLDGRLKIPIILNAYHQGRLDRVRGQADLIYVDGEFYLCAVIDVPEPEKIEPVGTLGIDMGIINLAADSDGEIYTGAQVDKVRGKTDVLKAALQSCETKNAKRHLKRLSGREERFRRNTNHCISKRVVAKAVDTRRQIAIENLEGLLTGATVRRAQRGRLHSWGFGQLRRFIEYKAALAGVPVIAVDPRNTSRTCPSCGHIEPRNRKGTKFGCRSCGYAGHADHIAALNIAARATVSTPIVATDFLEHPVPPLVTSHPF
jgi:IS605 OrfB family transposase